MQVKVTKQKKSVLELIVRSADVGDGFRKVGVALVPLMLDLAAEIPELLEIRNDDVNTFVRLTEKGKTVLKYI